MSLSDWIKDKEKRDILSFIGGGVALIGGALWSAYVYFDGKNGNPPKLERELSLRDVRPVGAFRRGTDATHSLRTIEFGIEFIASNKGNADVTGCRGEVITPKSPNFPLSTQWIYRQDGNIFSVKGGTQGQKVELHFVALTVQYDSTATLRLNCQDGIITPLIPIQLLEPKGSFDDGNVIAR